MQTSVPHRHAIAPWLQVDLFIRRGMRRLDKRRTRFPMKAGAADFFLEIAPQNVLYQFIGVAAQPGGGVGRFRFQFPGDVQFAASFYYRNAGTLLYGLGQTAGGRISIQKATDDERRFMSIEVVQ